MIPKSGNRFSEKDHAQIPRALRGLLLPVGLILLWELAARSGFIVAESLSFPSAILAAGLGTVRDGSLLQATQETFGAALAGMALGSAFGIACGIAFGLWHLLAALMRLSTEALRPIPSVALIP